MTSTCERFLTRYKLHSELVRIRPEPNAVRWFENADEQSLYLSVLTFGEIRKGLINVPQSPRYVQLETWLTLELRQRFAGRILPIDLVIAERWGTLIGEAKRTGKTIPVVDAILAATAWKHDLTVVSRNVADFELAGTPIVNPWLG